MAVIIISDKFSNSRIIKFEIKKTAYNLHIIVKVIFILIIIKMPAIKKSDKSIN